jgi:predicted TIM-barrel fold metal-dependent hydrolase
VPQTVLDQVWITTSGIFNEPPLYAALTTFGIDRIMFSIDYPYSTHMSGREFLNKIWLAPTDMEKFCHGNADALLKLKPGKR